MIINKIKKNHLCLGCGLCASVLGHDKCKMVLSADGFYYPNLEIPIDDSVVKKICPGIKVHGNIQNELWGKYIDVLEGWATDDKIRYHSSSGGVVSSIAVYLLQEHIVDFILQVGVSSEDYRRNILKVSKNRDDVLNNAQSRYAPALSLYNIKQILDENNCTCAFIGKACDIAGIKNFIETYPEYKDRIKLFISIICAGMPSLKGTEEAIKLSGQEKEPATLKYRGDGWPGLFKAKWNDGTEFCLTYHDSWGKILGRYLNFRCKLCADGIGSLADISVGDSWCTKDGYPDFEERDGRSLIFVRTSRGQEYLQDAVNKRYIVNHPIEDIEGLKKMQPGQYSRRKFAGWRILSFQVLTFGMLNFKGLGIYSNASKSNIKIGISNMIGTAIRYLKLPKEG